MGGERQIGVVKRQLGIVETAWGGKRELGW